MIDRDVSSSRLLRQRRGRWRYDAGTSLQDRWLLPAESLRASRNKPEAVLRAERQSSSTPCLCLFRSPHGDGGWGFLTTDARRESIGSGWGWIWCHLDARVCRFDLMHSESAARGVMTVSVMLANFVLTTAWRRSSLRKAANMCGSLMR
jgi:hypothetical protein